MTVDIEDLLASLEREPVGPAPTALIMRRARRRVLARRAASVAAVLAVVAGSTVAVTSLDDGGSSGVSTATVDETTTSTTAAPIFAPDTTPTTAPEATPTTAPPAPATGAQPGPTFEERRATYDRMVGDRESLRQGDLDAPELESSDAWRGRYDLALATDAPYTITVSLASLYDEAVAWFNNRYGPGLVFVANENANGAPPTAEGDPLWGRQFDGVSATEDGQPRDLPSGTRITFADRQYGRASMSWSGGCNSIGGAVTITADRLDVGYEVGSTSAGCDERRMAGDDWMTDLMRSDPHWVLNGDRLTVRNDHATLELVLASD